jgi:predicted TIM-barrel fold metal-dependent hydrolase
MNISVQTRPDVEKQVSATMAIADCDIHPSPTSMVDEVYPFLEKRWQWHLETFGYVMRQGVGTAYPKGQPDAARRDAWPERGGRPGSDLGLMQRQHLDPNNVQLGVLSPLRSGHALVNLEFATAFAHAMNQWQVEYWTSKDKRLKGSIAVPAQDADASVREIEHWAGHPDFAQVLLLSRTPEPLGNRRYWPIYEAAAAAGLPVGIHAFGAGGYPITGGGWPSYYIEDMTNHAQSCQSGLQSLLVEGVFARVPDLKVVLIESGFAWIPALGWRLDSIWKRLKAETPHLKMAPSEYMRRHVWVTSQPMEETVSPQQLLDTFEWIGWDKVMFATDYPHWDFDEPARVLPAGISEENRRAFFFENAAAVYGRP